jgi:hypothetical protein
MLTAAQWDHLILALIWGTAPASTAFVVVYGLTTRWWRNGFLGYALMFSSVGLASLVDAALAVRVLGDYQLRPLVLFVIFLFIFLGANFKFTALMVEKWHGRKYNYDRQNGYGHVVRDKTPSQETPIDQST